YSTYRMCFEKAVKARPKARDTSHLFYMRIEVMIIIKQDEVMKLDKEDLIQITGSLMQGGTLDDDLVISMLLSMLPNPPSKAKDAQKWLANAAGVKANDPRPTLKVLWADSGNMYASDGHRMHRISTDLADGCYDPKTLEPVNNSELK